MCEGIFFIIITAKRSSAYLLLLKPPEGRLSNVVPGAIREICTRDRGERRAGRATTLTAFLVGLIFFI